MLSVVIPVYNEKKTIEKVIDKIMSLTYIEKEIVVVDDASKDGTPQILESVKSKYPEIKVLFKKVNEGKGAALRDGFRISTGDYVIVQDADLEYDPSEYKKLLDALNIEKTDVVYGSRFSGTYEDMSNLHYIGNKVLTLITNVLFGVLLTDMETCYKLIPGDFARKVIIRSKRFDFEPEITAKILKSGLRIREVPISYKGRSKKDGKHITWKDGISALLTLIKFRIIN